MRRAWPVLALLGGCGPAAEDSAALPETASAGCTAAAQLADGEHAILVEGEERNYIARLPEGYSPDRAWPLVLALHPNDTGAWYWDLEDTPQQVRGVFAESILLFPDALGGDWRDYDADESTWPARMQTELAFLDAVKAEATAGLCVDTARIFSMGFSGGGSFSYVLACEREWVRAIATGGGVLYVEPETCTRAPAAWVTIGQGELGAGRLALRDTLAAQAGCSPFDEEPVVDEEPVCLEAAGCAPGTPVTYCAHPDGHIWPAFASPAVRDFFAALD